MPKSDTMANTDLNLTFCKIEKVSAPAQLWAACIIIEEDGTIRELAGNNYMRELVEQTGENYPGVFGSAENRAITNVRRFNFAKAIGGDWERFNGIGFYTGETGGELRYYGYLTLTDQEKAAGGKLVQEGECLYFDPGACKVTVLDYDLAIE